MRGPFARTSLGRSPERPGSCAAIMARQRLRFGFAGGVMGAELANSVSKNLPRYRLLALYGLGPVSYTHLRAHETRHDLVCRLLLEKKKTKKSINKFSI